MDQYQGERKVSAPVITLVAATPLNLYLVTVGRTAILKKVMWHNGAGVDTDLIIGTGLGLAWAALLPIIRTINLMSDALGEWVLPVVRVESTAVAAANFTMQSVIAGVTVVIEVEEV